MYGLLAYFALLPSNVWLDNVPNIINLTFLFWHTSVRGCKWSVPSVKMILQVYAVFSVIDSETFLGKGFKAIKVNN